MAIIRISKSVYIDILERASRLFDGRIRKLQTLPEGFGDRCYEAWLDMGHRQVIDTISRLPPGHEAAWVGLSNKIKIKAINDTNLPFEPVVELSEPRPIPYSSASLYFPVPLEIKGPHCNSLEEEYHNWREERNRIIERSNSFREDVAVFLGRMPTLNRAITICPALKEITPDIHKRFVTPVKKLGYVDPMDQQLAERITGEIVQAMMLEG